jgi:hypothetical protein
VRLYWGGETGEFGEKTETIKKGGMQGFKRGCLHVRIKRGGMMLIKEFCKYKLGTGVRQERVMAFLVASVQKDSL